MHSLGWGNTQDGAQMKGPSLGRVMDISRRVLPGARRYSHICLSWDATGSGPADCFMALQPPKPLLALSMGLYLLLSSAVLLPRHPLFLLIFPSLFSAAGTSILALSTFVNLSTLSLRILLLQQICYPRLFLMVPLWDQLFLCVYVCFLSPSENPLLW